MGSCWVIGAGGLPVGAITLGEAGDGRVWLDVCLLGQHLPQMYRPAEIRGLDQEQCARLGLCEDCLGFGDLDVTPAPDMGRAARGIDQVDRPCPGCGGSGRPAIRTTITRTAGSVTGQLHPRLHGYVPPLADDVLTAADRLMMAATWEAGSCLACGMPRDGLSPRGEALHP